MKLLCLWYERALSRLAVEGRTPSAGSRLAAHVEQCADCRGVWQELTLLASELPSALLDPLAPPELSMPLLPARKPRSVALRLSLAALATCGLLLAGIASGRLAPHSIAPGYDPSRESVSSRNMAQIAPPHMVTVQGPLTNVKVPDKKVSQGGNAERRPLAEVPETAMPTLASFEYTPVTRSEAPPDAAETMTPEAWGGLGACYAANGDYASAADAYARAYEAQPDPDFALAAGQSAENAGDMNEAVAYYLRVLETPAEPQSYPEEDELWNESLVTLSLELRSY